ncbi:hypothetical protein niasHS_012980 [Heterodera schachtii]|uniref:Uncharacterized protein n=1 Tax=Heterodera schachtii TaxID=97005 RepID=A0ABD2IT12_HETSC
MKRHSWLYKRRHQLKDIIENKPQRVIVENSAVTAPNVAPYMGIQKQQTPSNVNAPHRNTTSIQSFGGVSKSNTDVEEDTDFSTASDQVDPAAATSAASSGKTPHQKTPTDSLRTSPKNFPKMMGIIGKDHKKFGSHFTESLKHLTGQRDDVPRGHRFFIQRISKDPEMMKLLQKMPQRGEGRRRNTVKKKKIVLVNVNSSSIKTPELDSKWSVALSAIIYPFSFPSISVDEDDSISVKLVNPNYREDAGNSDEESQKFINLSMKIPNNAYDTKFGGSSLNDGTLNKRAKRQTELSETGAGVIEVENFFTRNPFDYWQQIGELRKKHYQLRERVEKMTKEYNSTKDGERKILLSTELGVFQGRETFLKEHLHLIEEEAKRRDGEQQEANEQRLVDRFFARYPDNYREQLDEWRSSYLRDVLDLQTKMGEYEGVKDLKRLEELNSQTERMRNSLHVFGRKMEILNNAALQRDQKRSQEEFERLSHEQNLTFVQEFFQANPMNYWQAIQKNYEALQLEYTKKRELREKFEFETDATERESLQRQIESIQRLIDYRRKRFAALEYEAKKRDAQTGKDNSGLNAVAEGSNRTNTTPTDSFSPDELANPDDQQNTTTATATSEKSAEQNLAIKDNSIVDKSDAGTPASSGLEQSGDVATSATRVEDGGNLPEAAALTSNNPKIVAKQSTVATERRKEKIIEKLIDEQVDRMVDGTHAQQKMLQEEGKDSENQHHISTYKLIEEVLHGEHGQLMAQQRESKMAAEFAYNEITQRFGIRMGPGVMHVDLSKQLSYVLGFDHKTRIYKNQSTKYPPDLSGGVRQLYVYAPKLVEDSIIGDRMAPLLRVVNVSGTPGLDMPEKIDKDSVEGLEGSLSLFSLPPTNVAINKTNVRELLPLSALNQTGPYLFRLFSDSQYCDLSKTYMYLLSSIERKNDAGEWVALSDTDPNDKHVGVIQNFGSSFVRSLKVNISGIEVFDSSIYYHYRDYIMKELGYSQEIRKAFHAASCYYPDDDDQNSATDPGFTARAARFSGGKQCETMVKLNFDLARQNALMLNNQDVIFTIHRNNDSFLLLTPPYKKPDGTLQENKKEYRIRVHDMRLYVRTVDVTPSLNLAISRQLESTSAKYPLRKIEMRSIFLGTGRTELAHNVFTSTLPRRLICTFVSTDAYSGNRKMSPYKFEHANVRSISVEANGQTFPSTPYLLSFDGTQPRFVRTFVDMYAGLGLDDSDTKTVSIGMQRFLNGWAFFVIPLTSTLEDTPGFELIRQGTCTIKVQFEQPIKADGYEMLVLGEFDSVLSINADRVLSTDGSV